MRARRTRIVVLVLGLGLFLESLRASSPVARVTETLCAPFLLCAKLVPPAALLRSAEVAAGEARLRERAEGLASESRALLADLARATQPSEPGILAEKRLVHGLVLGRDPLSKDRLRVRLRDVRGVVPGLPVACGNAYVGRVIEVEPRSVVEEIAKEMAGEREGTIVVELVTAKGFRVGARVATSDAREGGEGEVLMTVGGLLVSRRPGAARNAIRLAVEHPSSSDLRLGLARVHELFQDEEPLGALAEGLRLGTVQRDESNSSLWIAPELDFKDGLSYVVVLAPADPALGSALAFEPVLFDDHWVKARPLGGGDPSPWRSAVPLSVGEADGVRVGAAVTSSGAHLVGRITRVGRRSSELSFLDDPGLALVAVARFEGVERPVTLGRLIALGREGAEYRFRWIVRVPVAISAQDGPRRARLYTGAGEEGLPAGFFLGDTAIPSGARAGDVLEIRVTNELASTPADVLFVRLPEEEEP